MRATGNGQRYNRFVTSRAFNQGAFMALHFLGHHVVVGMRRRVLGVSGTVTGFALQIAVAFTESVEAEAGRRGIGIGRKTRISPNLQYAGCINCGLVTFAIVCT